MNQLIKNLGDGKAVAKFRDPFKKGNVKRITLDMFGEPSFARDNKCLEARIRFEAENTRGEQMIYANDLPDLLIQIQEFVENL